MCNTVVPKIIFDRTTGAAHEGMQRIHKALHVRIQVHVRVQYNTHYIFTYIHVRLHKTPGNYHTVNNIRKHVHVAIGNTNTI